MSYSSNNSEPDHIRRRIAIVGGGVGGWLAAAVLSRVLDQERYEIVLLRDATTARAPCAMGTLPAIQKLLALLGMDENLLFAQTRATCTLGAQFCDWGQIGASYFRGFGPVGAKLDGVAFHQHWLRLRDQGEIPPLADYSVGAVAARSGRFAPPLADRRSPFFWYAYAYHLDVERLTTCLEAQARQRQVGIRSGHIVALRRQAGSEDIQGLQLNDGSELEADLYLDCTGVREGLLQRAMNLSYQDWERWLPYDRALTVTVPQPFEPPVHARFTATTLGWQWQLPLRDRVELGYAYSAQFADTAQIEAGLRTACGAAADSELRPLQFCCGRPEKSWIGNCLFLGLCNPGPLAATELHLWQSGLMRLLAYFPAFTAGFDSASAAEYNRLSAIEHDGLRDFVIAHFKAGGREDSPLWRHCRVMDVSPALRQRLALFRSSGRLNVPIDDCFAEEDWLALLLGQQLMPERCDPLAACSDPDDTRRALQHLAATIREGVGRMPTHLDYLVRHGR